MHHPVFNLLVVFLLGILIGERFAFQPATLWCLLIGTVVASLLQLGKGKRALAQIWLFAAVLIAGGLRYRVATTILDPLHYANFPARMSGSFELVLDENPQVYEGAVVLSGE